MANLYTVYHRFNRMDPKKITGYVLIQSDALEEANKMPVAAEFTVSDKYDRHTQEQRAHKFAEYLNKIVEMSNDLEKSQEI